MPNSKVRDLVKEVSVVRDVSLIKVRTIKAKDVEQMRLFTDPVNPELLRLFEVVGVIGDYVIAYNPGAKGMHGEVLKFQIDRYVTGLMDYDTKRKDATEKADYDAINTEFNAIRQEVVGQLPQVFAA